MTDNIFYIFFAGIAVGLAGYASVAGWIFLSRRKRMESSQTETPEHKESDNGELEEARARIMDLQRRNRELLKIIDSLRTGADENKTSNGLPHPASPESDAVSSIRQGAVSITGYVDRLLDESAGVLGALQRKFLERIKANSENIVSLVDGAGEKNVIADARQPVASMLGYAELLLGESIGILNAAQRKFVERIKTASDRLSELTHDPNLDATPKTDTRSRWMGFDRILNYALAANSETLHERNTLVAMDISQDLFPLQRNREALFPWLDDQQNAIRHLTEITLDSKAQGAFIMYAERLWAYTGLITQKAAAELAGLTAGFKQSGDLLRYVNLQSDMAEFLLYSKHLSGAAVLWLAYDPSASIDVIRSEAGQIASAPTGDWTVRADGEALGQILIYLLQNAALASPMGGVVNVAVEKRLQAEQEFLVFHIHDSGTGVAQNELAHVFETGNDSIQGLGYNRVGLNIAKNLTELQKGYLFAKSNAGSGTEFVLAIPLEKDG